MLVTLTLWLAFAAPPQSTPPAANYDEAKVGSYTLPDPLKGVKNAKDWNQKRRPEILELFEANMHGRSPARSSDVSFNVFDKGTPALDGKAIRKQVEIRFSGKPDAPKADLLVYTPAAAKKRVPLVLYLSFTANSATVDDPGIRPGEVWNREHRRVSAADSRFPKIKIDDLLAAGFGFATIYYGDIEPDFAGATYGVRTLYPSYDWGAVAAWAWGASRALDYLETDHAVDAKKVAIAGVSRLGKTALWAGARDPRFGMVIACCSGEGGASLSRRDYGETVKNLNTTFPYWFSPNYLKFGDHVDELPFDAHMLIALIAPRSVYLSTGSDDRWADPKGEFLAAVAAGPVYRLLGKQDLDTDQMPPPDQPILHDIGFHMHTGGHGANAYDWQQYLKFLQLHFSH